MSDTIILKSVGSYLDTNGHVGPLDAGGLPDLEATTDLADLDIEWVGSLSEDDLAAVNEVRKDFGMGPVKKQSRTVCTVWFTVIHDDDDGPSDDDIVEELKSLVDNYPDLVAERTEVTEDSHLVELDEAEGGAS